MSPGRGLRSRLAVEAYASSTRAGSNWGIFSITPLSTSPPMSMGCRLRRAPFLPDLATAERP